MILYVYSIDIRPRGGETRRFRHQIQLGDDKPGEAGELLRRGHAGLLLAGQLAQQPGRRGGRPGQEERARFHARGTQPAGAEHEQLGEG